MRAIERTSWMIANRKQPSSGSLQSRLACRWVSATLAPLALMLLVLVSLGSSDEIGEGHESLEQNPSTSIGNGNFSLIDWNSYKKIFSKDYSSLTQQLLRQQIFLANNIKVYLLSSIYRLYGAGYYTVINQFSDLTAEEAQRKLSGDGGEYPSDDEYEDDDDLMDDEQIRETLLQDLEDQRAAAEENKLWDQSVGRHSNSATRAAHLRQKRDASDSNPANEQEADSDSYPLTLIDLVRVPGSRRGETDSSDSPESKLKIRWVVPSNNPDYEPVDHMSYGLDTGPEEENLSVQEDIPEDKIDDIGATTSSWLSIPVGKVAGALTSSAKSTLSWIKSSFSDDATRVPLSKSPSLSRITVQMAAAESAKNALLRKTKSYKNELVVDWRQSGCVAPPMDQGPCQSCYAVSSTAFLEWAFCMNQNRTLTPLSVQYMISCGPQFKQESDPKLKIQFYGCNRGRSRQAMYFVKDYGAELAANMPYLARDTECPVNPNTPLKRKGYIRPNVKQHVRMAANTNQLELALKVGPVIVNFREPIDFLAYGGGMVGKCYQRGGHAMLVVGHGIENDNPYLIIKNSFGANWGMGGYFKFDRKYTTECVKDFILPRVSFPSKKAQARRVKAYLASQKARAVGKEPFNPETLFDVGAGGLFSIK